MTIGPLCKGRPDCFCPGQLPVRWITFQDNGFKVVHMVPKDQVTTLPQFDEAVLKDQKLPTVSQRPTSSVVRTISEVPGDAKQ